MKHAVNSDKDLGTEGWHKPWSGTNGGNCVQAKKLDRGRVALRQSADPGGAALIFTLPEIAEFIAGIKDGKADFLIA
ncbi:DUF397 domain-containing protein [Streptomyces aurantiacus]|uniref:DUF397 domain-containing protein n=1 Tax=Streptomyces aurantiacus TaxID=47760 RepID=A0A7G1NZX9_9ACTN|nr:DUF397 domain-containing protein [Streptomyces aurantiacus]BCL28539.1 hypothetical protein GCM10017557_33980 [Streptomyces aurantiacus]